MQYNRAFPPDHAGAKGHSDTSFRPSVKTKFCLEYFIILGTSLGPVFKGLLATRKVKYTDMPYVGLGLETNRKYLASADMVQPLILLPQHVTRKSFFISFSSPGLAHRQTSRKHSIAWYK